MQQSVHPECHISGSYSVISVKRSHFVYLIMTNLLILIPCTGSPENYRQFADAMKHGHIRTWQRKVLFYGAGGSGNTSTTEMILGNPPPVDRTSTPLAIRPTTVYRINLDGKEWTKITTLEERRVFLARALIQSAPNLAWRLLATRPKEASSSSNQPVSTVAVSQVQSKDQASPDQGKPPPLDDQPPSASLQPASLDHGESDEDIDSEVDDILESISTDRELVKLMGQLSTTVDPLAFFRFIQIIDAGNQPQFHEIFPVFLRNLSFYVFVFRLCDDLAKHPVVEFYVDGKPVGSFTSAQSIEQLLQHCVRCIHSHRSPTGSESECPQIMVIGTHVDQEKKSSETRDEKNRKILQILSPLDQKQIVYHNLSEKKVLFAVNAMARGNIEEISVKQIREALLSEGSMKPVDIPSRWFALEILLEEMVQALKRGVLSKEDCITAATEKLHFEEDGIDAALQYLDQVSAILYYPKILSNVVFADPQVLLDKVSELVFKSAEIEKLSKEQALTGDWIKFHEFGLVTIQFLSREVFSKHYVPGLFEVDDLVLLFKKLLIFASFSKSEYFVPALLRHLDSKAVDDHRVISIPCLVLQFPGGGPRQGIFCALLCWLVSPENDSPAPWSISVDEVGSPVCLYRNCIQFDIPNSLSTVTLIDTYTHFEAHMDIPLEDAEDLCPEEFPVVRKAIDKGLHKAALNLGYFNSSPSPALLCPCGRGEAHVAEIIKSTYWKCSLKNEARKIGKLTPLQRLWLVATPVATEKCKRSESHLPELLRKLNDHACRWRDIGMYLGFRQGELDYIQGKPLLLTESPRSWLREMLGAWLEWAPGDSRGSDAFASIESLKCALAKSGLTQTALDIQSHFEVHLPDMQAHDNCGLIGN